MVPDFVDKARAVSKDLLEVIFLIEPVPRIPVIPRRLLRTHGIAQEGVPKTQVIGEIDIIVHVNHC
jgi:hypothetical protein